MQTVGRTASPEASESVDGKRSIAIDVLVGAAIGLAMACVIFDRSFFWGDDALVRGIANDAGSSFAGFRAYIADDWHFPLLETDDLTNRAGEPTIIAFTDSLPLLGLIAKSLGFLGLSADTWIAVWYYGNIVLLGGAAGLAAGTHRVSSRWTTAAIALMAVSAPVMIIRVWHPGLYGHFTILLLWAAAGELWHRRSSTAVWWFVPVILLSLLVHPYFFVMNGVVAAGIILAAGSRGLLTVRETSTWFVVTPIIVVAVMYLFGYLPSNAVPPGGYGAFAMPVVSPFWPQWSGLWPGDEWILLNEYESFEGINYLGAGAVIAVLAAVALSWRRLGVFLIREQVLVVVLAVLTLTAITHRVYFWNQTPLLPLGEELSALNNRERGPVTVLAAMALVGFGVFLWSWRSARGAVIRPAATTLAALSVFVFVVTAYDRRFFWDQLQQFRASGRFFWVIGYGITLGAIILIDRWFSARRDRSRTVPFMLGVTMIALSGLQIADTGKYRDFVPEMFFSSPERVEWIDDLGSIVTVHDEVRITPDWHCILAVNEALTEFQDVVIAATSTGVLINGYYGGRTATNVPCPTEASAPGGGVLTVVVRPIHYPELIDAASSVECRFSQHMAVCSSRWDRIDEPIRDRFAAIPLPWPPS